MLKKMIPVLFLFGTIFTPFAEAQVIGTKGTEFWLGFMPNYGDGILQTGATEATLHLTIAGKEGTTGSIQLHTLFAENFTIGPEKIMTIAIPTNLCFTATPTDIPQFNAIHVSANDSVFVYASNIYPASSDATNVLPLQTLGSEYWISAYQPIGFEGNPELQYSEFMVVATEDNTLIEITPSKDTRGGKAADVPYTFLLMRGATCLVQSYEDLTGSYVRSVDPCKRINVFGGSVCSDIAADCCCDHLYEQMYPAKTLGKKFLTVPLASRRKGDTFTFLATEDSTIINVNGTYYTRNKGQVSELIIEDPSYIQADKPIVVTQFSNSVFYDKQERAGEPDAEYGDPFQLNVLPLGQGLDRVDFSLIKDPNTRIEKYFANIVIRSSDVNSFQLDGISKASAFMPYIYNPLYAWAQIEVDTNIWQHHFTAAGLFQASLYAYGDYESYGYVAGSNMRNLSIGFTIDSLDMDDAILCRGEELNFIPNIPDGMIPASFYWDFGDGGNSDVQNPVHQYDSAGQYTIKFYVTQNASCGVLEDSVFATITVVDPVQVMLTSDTAICYGDSIQLSASGGDSYRWFPSTGLSDPYSASPKAFPDSTTIYRVEVNAGGGPCPGLDSVRVTVHPLPQPYFTAMNVCQGDSIYFTDSSFVSSGTISAWAWDFGDSTTAALQHPVHYYDSAGSYTITLSVQTNKGCHSSTYTKTLQVNAAPRAAFSSSDVCLHEPAVFADSSFGGSPVSWQWDFGDSTYSAEQHPQHLYNASGIYSVKLKMTNSAGCSDSIVKNIQVWEQPEIVLSKDTTIRPGGQAMIAATVSGGSGQYEYTWTPYIGTGPGPYEVSPGQTTAYSLRVTDTESQFCPEASDTVWVWIVDECDQANLHLPTAFSPNGDGINDAWPVINRECLKSWNLKIYNRWGELISEHTEQDSGWNGGWKNDLSKKSPVGAYVYILHYTDKKGNTDNKTGMVTLSE